ncbi:ABC transporter permease subunit [Mesorhizobium sp. M0118]|uniref:ABC transporter permease n=1 Tax=Mesorhizobium sp. M0118 TaxID=2956884 RepID=UPI00333551DB
MAEPVSFFTVMGFGPEGWGPLMIKAAGMTLSVSLCGYLTGLLIGILGAWAKLRGGRLTHHLAKAYTTILRGIPDLLVIFILYFGSAAAIRPIAHLGGYEGFLAPPGFLAGFLAIGVISGAYQTEVLRGAAQAVSKGELEAAKAYGMGGFLLFRRVLTPLALRCAIPGLANIWQMVLKEAALVSVTGVVELVRQAQLGAGATRDPFSFYIAACCLYLVITTVTGLMFQIAEARVMRGVRQ